MNNNLIVCPNCLMMGKRSILGSVNNDGDLLVQRYRGSEGTTTIKSDNYKVLCVCGFGTVVQQLEKGKTNQQIIIAKN